MTSRIGRPSAAKVAAARHRLNPPTAHTAGVAIDADPLQEIPSTLTPDRSWFFNIPDWYDPDGALIQLDPTLKSSRVAAMVAPYGECILNGRAGCWTPPPSQTGYEYAHVGSIVTADGAMLRVANIGGSINHFDTSLPTAASLAADHYANTATDRKSVV